jgi:hypothetical protein
MMAAPPPPPPDYAALLYERVKATIRDGVLTPTSAVVMLTTAMAQVEAFAGMGGPEKKSLVLDLVDRLLGEIPVAQADGDAIRAAVRLLLPAVVDAVVAAAGGAFGINVTAAARRCSCC